MDETIISEIRKTKRQLEAGSPQLKAAFERITERIRREADTIQSSLAGGRSPLPEVDFKAVAAGTVSDAAKNEMRKRGFAIVRGVYPGSQAEAWNDELGRYIEDNEYFAKAEQKRGLDNYFSQLDAAKPQIFGIYWSKPQVHGAAGGEHRPGQAFPQPPVGCRRTGWPGVRSRTMTTPMPTARGEGGRATRRSACRRTWIPGPTSGGPIRRSRRSTSPVFAGKWEDYDPWKAAYRTRTKEYPSPAVCSHVPHLPGWTR